ncbi:MAG: hypothetical protein ACFFD2_16990 [Promethearchaeota archaeon]
MTFELFFNKLNQNLEMAKENLRIQLMKKISYLTNHLEDFSSTEIREELENLVDDFISQFSVVYQEFISYLEDEIPSLSKPQKKPQKKKTQKKKETKKNEFIRPTYVHKAFNNVGLRVAKDAKPILMDLLNKKIEKDIETIKMQLPTFRKGEKKGERKRVTIKPEDLSKKELMRDFNRPFEKELETISLKLNGSNYELSILLRHFD